MNKNLYALMLVPFLFIKDASACTIFTAVKGMTVLFASNEDQTSNNSYLVIDPTGKYGVVFFATPTADSPLVMQMGINEKGLSYDINSISEEKLIQLPNKIPQKEWALVALMKEVGSVDELLNKIFDYDWGTSIAYQIHIADRFGNAAVIHPGLDGKLTYTRIDKNKGYLISTNFNLRDLGLFNKILSPRYRAADRELNALPNEQSLTPAFMTSILEKTHQTGGWINSTRTIYSTVLNLNTLEINFYYESQFDKPYRLDVRSELAKTREKKVIPLPGVMASIRKN